MAGRRAGLASSMVSLPWLVLPGHAQPGIRSLGEGESLTLEAIPPSGMRAPSPARRARELFARNRFYSG